jgi:plasmid stabilization system protein ParE
MILTVDPEAAIELQDAASWYEGERAGLGDRFLDAIAATMERITGGPHTFPALPSGLRRALVARFPYMIIFVADSERVHVVAFAHAKRRPDYWAKRTKRRPVVK